MYLPSLEIKGWFPSAERSRIERRVWPRKIAAESLVYFTKFLNDPDKNLHLQSAGATEIEVTKEILRWNLIQTR